ncbi:MAG: NAD(P)H-dependent oxidoreductase [Alphaproteobacteria bacterium]|nr:NAD(P)H-dependent oxidoreductase [Alphaproteobacteria bacterium]
MAGALQLLVVVGNPKAGSRTLDVAREVARQIEVWLASRGVGVEAHTIDLAELSAGLFDWGNGPANAAMDRLKTADLLIVASPVYKATFTGLLKAFLDRVPMEGLGGRPAVPVMVAAAPGHGLAVDAYLRPLLVEIGASCPTRALLLLESQLPEAEERIAKWLETARPVLARALGIGDG